MSRRALITGVGGQDGSYLAEYLLSLGYYVTGTIRATSAIAYSNLQEAAIWSVNADTANRFELIRMDLRDELSVAAAIRKSRPDEIYNLGGQVFVPTSWQAPEETFDVNMNGLLRILRTVKDFNPNIKVYQASSSEMFGNVPQPYVAAGTKLSETTPMHPVSPYGVSKLAAHELARVYRELGLFVCCGILMNHESPRRGPEMVTRKITQHVADWKVNNSDRPLRLGNPYSKRDWGFAGDYVQAMHMMLDSSVPEDFVIGTGVSHTVGQFVDTAIEAAGLNIVDYKCQVIWDSPQDIRQNELNYLAADTRKAKEILGWRPKVEFKALVEMMVQADIKRLEAK